MDFEKDANEIQQGTAQPDNYETADVNAQIPCEDVEPEIAQSSEQFDNAENENCDINKSEQAFDKIENKSKNIKKEIVDWVVSIVLAVIIALVVRTYIFTLVRVDGQSMVPTLSHGDTLYTNRFFYQPKNGDIIVFRPVNSPETPYIKRIIATEGQTIAIDEASKTVTVDGVVLDEPYIAEPMLSGGNMQYPLTVPEGYVFAMGDNRNHSLDSRSTTVGVVPEQNIIGQALFRLLPLSGFGILK